MTYTATELESSIWGKLDECSIREPSDAVIGMAIQHIVAPDLFNHLEWDVNTQNIVFEALAKAHQRELEKEERLRA
jgi:hypothetical protein